MNKIWKAALACLLIAMTAVPAMSEGLPLPWPFPWARQCSVDWAVMQGSYFLSESSDYERIELQVTDLADPNYRMVNVARVANDGTVLFSGVTTITARQKTVHLFLSSVSNPGQLIWASIKLHYTSGVKACSPDMLVPILTIENSDDKDHSPLQYRMIKTPCPKN